MYPNGSVTMPPSHFLICIMLVLLSTGRVLAAEPNVAAPLFVAEGPSPSHNHGHDTDPVDEFGAGALIPDDALPDLTMRPKREKPVPASPPPPIQRDVTALPAPVRATREALMEAARSGDIEALRAYIVDGADGTMLSLAEIEGDSIEFLRQSSGDDEGFEILAILLEVLEAGYVHLDIGTDEELYVWPYFIAWPLESLSNENRVELFRLLTAGDVQDSEQFGSYIFYRVGIRPDGEWRFFVAGD